MKRIKGRNITVVGLARSGAGAANLLAGLGAQVTVTDRKGEDELRTFLPMLSPGIKCVLGSHPDELFTSADMVVISPGVPLSIRPLEMARSEGVPVISEIELAYLSATAGLEGMPSTPLVRNGFLAVTGTNGKSTTTALLDFMMKKGGYSTMLGGNIGNALTEEIYKSMSEDRVHTVDWIVAEISSFQLEAVQEFRPRGAALLNLTPDHLDRYHSLGEYGAAKARVFENQRGSDFLILNKDDSEAVSLCESRFAGKGKERPRVHFFSRRQEVEGLYVREGSVFCNMPALTDVPEHSCLIAAEDIRIKGIHNLENAMAASAMALLAGCTAEAVVDSLRQFEGLEHRLEPVRELEGVRYINDSKGTNVGAVLKSLESFSEPVILIAGGRDKAGDFSLLRDLVKERVKALVLIGEASEKIKKALGDVSKPVMAKSLTEAVEVSRQLAQKGDVVLLSPACASFDMFSDFEDRGRQFKKIVMGLS